MKRGATAVELDWCRVVVVNELINERKQRYSPHSAQEALEADRDVALAKFWVGYLELQGPEDNFLEPVAVAIHRTDNELVVHWHAVDADVLWLPGLWQAVLQLWEDWADE